MYVTRPLSLYKKSPSELSLPPPEGPNTGILVIQDEEAESRFCFGLFKKSGLKALPFPQNKNLQLYYTTGGGDSQYTDWFYAVLIPVLNHPLSSNHYYLIKSRGSRKGNAYTSSKEEDMSTCCFCRHVRDVPPQPFDVKNTYQQFVISNYTSCGGPYGFVARSLANDGIPPKFLGWKGWHASTKPLKNLEPVEAQGLDAALRAKLPEFTFSLPCKSSNPVVVAKWYSPFIFIRDGKTEMQVRNSTYYEWTLEQNWEEMFECQNDGEGNGVDVDVDAEKVGVYVGGSMAESVNVADGVMWFAPFDVGLSLVIVDRVKWEQERSGFEWVELEGGRYGEKERVRKREEFRGMGEWRRFGCYVLVERYVLKRMDGSVVLTWEFKHIHQIRSKWE